MAQILSSQEDQRSEAHNKPTLFKYAFFDTSESFLILFKHFKLFPIGISFFLGIDKHQIADQSQD